MMNKKQICTFEQLLNYCQQENCCLDELINIDYADIYDDCRIDQLYEKYEGTWWEIDTDSDSAKSCSYIADSIDDAIRLKPDTSQEYWQNAISHYQRAFEYMYEFDFEPECI